MAGELDVGAEEGLGFGEKQIEMCEAFGGGVGEQLAGESMGGWLRRDDGWRLAACGEVAATSDRVLKDALWDGGLSAGGSALDEAGVDDGFGAGVGEEQVLGDLLDAPFTGRRGWSELGLVGVEPSKRGGDLALKSLKDGVHRWRTLQDYVTWPANAALLSF